MVDNNTTMDNLEKLLVEVNATTEDTDANDAKFNAPQKLKVKQLLREALKMFLQLTRESEYKGFRSLDMADKAVDANMKKKLEEVRKQYSRPWRLQPHGRVQAKGPSLQGEDAHRQVKEHVQRL